MLGARGGGSLNYENCFDTKLEPSKESKKEAICYF